MRKGKKIKRGRKGKHLGVLYIPSAPNTHLGHGKTPSVSCTGPHNLVCLSTLSALGTVDQRAEIKCGWMKAGKQYHVPLMSESQIGSRNARCFLFLKTVLGCLTENREQREREGERVVGRRETKQTVIKVLCESA